MNKSEFQLEVMDILIVFQTQKHWC